VVFLDNSPFSRYNNPNFIRQFVTILSLNKTREIDGRSAPIFFGETMRKNTRYLTHCAMIAALYVVLTHLQNLIFPNSASMAIQFRASEALCILAFFTPAAIYGLAAGCLVFNITYAGALPLDFLVGSLATLSAAWVMWKTRNWKIFGYPLLGMLMPALTNAIAVGWELDVYIGGGFWINAFYVALGELLVMLTLGTALQRVLERRSFARFLRS
jgi:uncharacterized membrane protein